MTKMIWGAPVMTLEDQQQISNLYASYNYSPSPKVPSTRSGKPDPFCNQNQVLAQRLFEGKKVNLLYNVAPVTSFHFLIVTKKCRNNILEMNKKEFAETWEIINKISQKYCNATLHVYTIVGKDAGRTIPHCHFQVLLTKNERHERKTLNKIFYNMFFSTPRLSPEQLKKNVELYKALKIPL
jgi:diadenosine tetraphosphate (Ap4A) HIT family hydrolase